MAKKKLASLVQVEKKSQKVKDFVKKCNYKICISFTSNLLDISSSISTYYSSNFLATIFVQMSDTAYWSMDKKINYFIKMIKDLALSIWTLQNNTSPFTTKNI